MENYKAGDVVRHKDLPGFLMTVKDVRPCETDMVRPQEHLAYRVVAPGGGLDWVCGYEVSKVEPQRR